MTPSELLATAAHLHVAIRRKTGRVTDVEWLASNAEYAEAMTRLASAHAASTGDEDLQKWAMKLAQGWAESVPNKTRSSQPAAVPAADERAKSAPGKDRYVVGLRC